MSALLQERHPSAVAESQQFPVLLLARSLWKEAVSDRRPYRWLWAFLFKPGRNTQRRGVGVGVEVGHVPGTEEKCKRREL